MSQQEKLVARFKALKQTAKENGVAEQAVNKLLVSAASSLTKPKRSVLKTLMWVGLLGIIFAVAYINYETMDPKCLVANNLFLLELARPAVKCDLCKDLESIPIVNGNTFSKQEFHEKYAYTGVPVLVKGGARNWTALDTFSYDYLKRLYTETDGALRAIEEDCQFFPYKTSFLTMAEVFNMSSARSRIEKGEQKWYVGWSNCHPDVAKELRKHYRRPTFLPDDSESSSLDWLFMGGFGGGADVHIDYVQRPSWQAMIAGKKTWYVVPSPECDTICRSFNATMEKGDIILIDTNMWYHSTFIHPGEVSITIGSEYD